MNGERMITKRRWTDDAGVEWVRRGDRPTPKRVQRLLADPDVAVRIWGGPERWRVLPGERRAEYWTEIAPFLTGKATGLHGQVDYEAGEFRDADGRTLLVVEEFC